MQIKPLESIISDFEGISGAKKTGKSESSFTNIFSDALNNVVQTEQDASAANQALLTGEADDTHTAVIAAQKAEIALSLAVQVRNKVIESYNNVMNMQL